ncbi:DinB family protein [Salinimicrobium marinum]|nr:DinB family protein [Salinimicrobium marinum]
MEALKKQLVKHLNGGEAFMPLEEMLKEISFQKLGERPKNLPYSFYELFYHICFTQNDILNYCTEIQYKAPNWPKDYWPAHREPQNEKDWRNLVENYRKDREELTKVIMDPEIELTETVPSNSSHTFLREILLVIEHSAYHSGQMLIVLRHLGLHTT